MGNEFEQADATTTRRYGGTGLRLAFVRGLAKALGGTLAIQSIEGHGTTMRVCVPLPRCEASSRATAAREKAS